MLALSVGIFPNTFRFISIPVFLFCGSSVLICYFKTISKTALFTWAAGCTTTLLYMLIGLGESDPTSYIETAGVYIVSPLMWIAISSFTFRVKPLKDTMRVLLAVGFAGTLSVPIYFSMFVLFGASSVSLIVTNVEYSSGYGGVSTHIFGVLLFFAGGFFASPLIIKSTLYRMCFAFSLVGAALISGRTALFLSFTIGLTLLMVNYFLWSRDNYSRRSLAMAVVLVPGLVFLMNYILGLFNFDIGSIYSRHADSVATGGGFARTLQTQLLLNGIIDSNALGVGHGVGVSYTRSVNEPWKYEILWLATIYRVGIIGSIVYAFPVIYTTVIYVKTKYLKVGVRSVYDDFLFAGSISVVLASYTNPYLESFDFQWMVFLPFVYFVHTNSSLKKARKVYQLK